MNAQAFGCFLMDLLQKNVEIQNKLSDYVFVMDNAAFDKAKLLKPFFSHFHLLYLSPYAPY